MQKGCARAIAESYHGQNRATWRLVVNGNRRQKNFISRFEKCSEKRQIIAILRRREFRSPCMGTQMHCSGRKWRKRPRFQGGVTSTNLNKTKFAIFLSLQNLIFFKTIWKKKDGKAARKHFSNHTFSTTLSLSNIDSLANWPQNMF